MKNDNVIQFPKEQAVRVRLQERNTQRRSVLALSILSVLMLSVISNQWLTKSSEQAHSRGIASVGEVTISNVKWEHELANTLSSAKGVSGNMAERPSLRDELVFGELEGRYGVRIKDGRVESLEYTAREGESALGLKDRSAFLMKYRSVLAVNFDQAGLASSAPGTETWNLMNSDKTIVGTAKFSLDQSGNVTSINLNQ